MGRYRKTASLIGAGMLVLILCGALVVKYSDLLAVRVEAGTVESQYMDGVLQKMTVQNGSIAEEQGRSYVYIVERPDHYWLDGNYARRREVRIEARGTRISAISFIAAPSSQRIEAGKPLKVVLDPAVLRGKERKIVLANE